MECITLGKNNIIQIMEGARKYTSETKDEIHIGASSVDECYRSRESVEEFVKWEKCRTTADITHDHED